MSKLQKTGPSSIPWKSANFQSELDYSRPPVVISSASFKRYDLEDREIPNNTVSLSSIAGRFIPSGLKFSSKKDSY